MFTGIIQCIGVVANVTRKGPGVSMRVKGGLDLSDGSLGESIAVDGACLTVTAFGDDWFDVDASHETLARTTLGDVRAGRRVNLERALRVGDRLGGHFVSGHVDARGRLRSRKRVGEAWVLDVEAPADLAPFLVEKGSVAVDGVSLTVNAVAKGSFTVTIIPFTGGETTLLEKSAGEAVNVETDLLGKYVVHNMGSRGGGGPDGLAEALRRQGFL